MNTKKKIALFTAAAAASAALLIGGTYAYLTDYDAATNEFTVGKVDIELEEPTWDPKINTDIIPAQEINKDPQITNKGTNEAFVYLEVSVPMQKLITADEAGNRIDAALIELFTFKADKSWTKMDSYVKGSNKVYLYSYNNILKPSEKTTALFKKMNFANVVEGQIDGKTFQVPVRANAIQTANTRGTGATLPEQAKNAFNTYINQNKGGEGKVTTN